MSSPRASVCVITEQLKLHHGQIDHATRCGGAAGARPWDGAFMEPRGCNWWQSTANRTGPEAPKTSQNRCRPLRPVAARSNANALHFGMTTSLNERGSL